ncbi:hypothetical protein HanXRQr2_Chr02g0076651 [Helianthus annuus]|uniref:Uncharacterized protein n=1 Tax=Helianthus annuus TaxID=4232 RepID=A0A9K3P1X3_HELAN|nr:hypothetical protein HanXRQr2_Chr02g0076651 [Helianthus annuus]
MPCQQITWLGLQGDMGHTSVPQIEPPPSQSPHHHEQSLLMTSDRRPPWNPHHHLVS